MNPHFVCIGDVILNVDRIVDAGWALIPWKGGHARCLVVSFAAPTPKIVSVSGEDLMEMVGTACRQIVIPETDPAADNLWLLLRGLCDPPEAIGTMPGKVIAS